MRERDQRSLAPEHPEGRVLWKSLFRVVGERTSEIEMGPKANEKASQRLNPLRPHCSPSGASLRFHPVRSNTSRGSDMGAEIVCQVIGRPDQITFIWSEGPASFEPYQLNGQGLVNFRNLAQQARQELSNVVR